MRALALLSVAAAALQAGVAATGENEWRLRSGAVELRLLRDAGGVRPVYLGPAGGGAWQFNQDYEAPRAPAAATVDLTGGSLRVTSTNERSKVVTRTTYTPRGDTGVFTVAVVLRNDGAVPVMLTRLDSLAWTLPPGVYELTYLWGGWGQERQIATEILGPGSRVFTNARGRSTSIYSPWFALLNQSNGVRYGAQLEWSGNWEMRFERQSMTALNRIQRSRLAASLGMLPEGGATVLASGAELVLPPVAFSAAGGTLDDLTNQMHRYQREFVLPKQPANRPPLVQFNTWYAYPDDKLDVKELKQGADIAAELGIEVFMLDAGWYSSRNWSTEMGDYEVNRRAFPNGLEELADHVRARGMRFGLWVEIENAGVDSKLIREHPDWCLQRGGKPLIASGRCNLNFAKPEVKAWARATIDRLVKAYRLGWIKIDYNIDIGSEFDPGQGIRQHIEAYHSLLEELRAAHPDLIIENCSSGALRMDLAMLRRTDTSWLSDAIEPKVSLQLGYGCTVEFTPEVCNHWMVGEVEQKSIVDYKAPAGWWDFLLRVPMNGQWGISSRIWEWPPELRQRAKDNVALFKRIRTTITGADVYHLTPVPDRHDPQDWMAIQYVNGGRSVVRAYRLAGSTPDRIFHLRGLDPARKWRVRVDGADRGLLPADGLRVSLDAEFRAAIIELDAE